MSRWVAVTAAVAAVAAALCARSAFAATSGDAALAKYSAAWDKVKTYTCAIAAHEVSGSRVQDRTYNIFFRKPHDTRMDITSGDGHGGAAVWHGGDTVKGHQGGFISFIKLNLNIHDSKAVSIRGTTIADANFGALLDHIKGLAQAKIGAQAEGDKTKIDVTVADPSADQNVTRELMVLGANDLPVEYDEWEGSNQVKHVTYADLKLNVDLPDSTFNL